MFTSELYRETCSVLPSLIAAILDMQVDLLRTNVQASFYPVYPVMSWPQLLQELSENRWDLAPTQSATTIPSGIQSYDADGFNRGHTPPYPA